MDAANEIGCTLKPAVYLVVPEGGARAADSTVSADRAEEASGRRPSGCQVMDVIFHVPTSCNVEAITFHNFYTHSLTLKFKSSQISNFKSDNKKSKTKQQVVNSGWKTCLMDHRLMPSCHGNRGGCGLVVLTSAHFLCPLHRVERLRLILRQPSQKWVEFGIRDIHCYSTWSPFQWNGTKTGDGMEMGPDDSGDEHSLVQRMEKVLGNGLWTKQNETETGTHISPAQTVTPLHYHINLLP